MSVDAQRLMDSVTYINMLWSGPFQIAVSLYFLHRTMGWSIYAGLGVMVIFTPINFLIARKANKFQVLFGTMRLTLYFHYFAHKVSRLQAIRNYRWFCSALFVPTTLIWDGKPPAISNLRIWETWNSSILNLVYINAFSFENVKFPLNGWLTFYREQVLKLN